MFPLQFFENFLKFYCKEHVYSCKVALKPTYFSSYSSVKFLYHELLIIRTLPYFSLMFHFYTSWKRQKSKGFLTFSGGIEMDHWLKWLNDFRYEITALKTAVLKKICGSNDCGLPISVTHFMPLVSFYTPWKHQKITVFLMFPGA